MQSLSQIMIAAALAGAAPGTQPAAAQPAMVSDPAVTANEEDLAALNAWTARWQRLYNAGNAQAMRDMYTDDAVLMSHGGPRLIGKDAIIAFLGRNKAAGNSAAISFAPEEVIIEGNSAYWTAQYWLTVTLANGREIPLKGRSFLIFKKGADGQWRLWRDMDNQASDVPDEEPAQ